MRVYIVSPQYQLCDNSLVSLQLQDAPLSRSSWFYFLSIYLSTSFRENQHYRHHVYSWIGCHCNGIPSHSLLHPRYPILFIFETLRWLAMTKIEKIRLFIQDMTMKTTLIYGSHGWLIFREPTFSREAE